MAQGFWSISWALWFWEADMLQQMLRLVADGDVTTREALAHALGVSQELVSQMMSQLAAQGYLADAREYPADAREYYPADAREYPAEGEQCVGGCTGCGLSTSCGIQEGLRIWTLTEKGWRAVARRREASGTAACLDGAVPDTPLRGPAAGSVVFEPDL